MFAQIEQPNYFVNDQVKTYLKDLFDQTMFIKKDMGENVSIIFDSTKGHLVVEYIGYKGTDFHNGHYYIAFELPIDYPNSPPRISVLTESGRFHAGKHLSLSISHYHRESWYPMPLTFLVVNMLSAFSDYNIYGIGHNCSLISKKEEVINKIKLLVEKTSEYNEQHYPKLYNKFKKIKILKDSESVDDIQNFIDDKMSKL